nr:hypothetical protein [uncultured Methanospirillum sp.]
MKSKDNIRGIDKKTMETGMKPTQETEDKPDGQVHGTLGVSRNRGKQVSTDVKSKKLLDLAQMKANQISSKIKIKAHQVLAGNRKK